MFKKVLLAASAICLMSSAQAAGYKDGTYVEAGQGNAGMIRVQVVVEQGKISSVKVLRHSDTPELLQSAIEGIAPAVIKANGLKGVEAVSGASMSSEGIMEAVKKCLDKAQK